MSSSASKIDSSASAAALVSHTDYSLAKKIQGNVSLELKERIRLFKDAYGITVSHWGNELRNETRIISIDLNDVPPGPSNDFPAQKVKPRKEAVIVYEVKVHEFMCNGWEMMHGGCICTLMDYCTSMPIPVLLENIPEWRNAGLTMQLNVQIHAPALKGETIRVIAKTIAGGKRSATVFAEMFTKRGLIATATNIKMCPTVGPASKL